MGGEDVGDFADEVETGEEVAFGVRGEGVGADLRGEGAPVGGCGGYSGRVFGGEAPELLLLLVVASTHREGFWVWRRIGEVVLVYRG